MIVDYRSPARETGTVQLDETGGRRPAIPSPSPLPTPPSVTVPCRLWASWSVYLHCIAGRRFTAASSIPTCHILWAGDLAGGLSRLVKASNHKAVC